MEPARQGITTGMSPGPSLSIPILVAPISIMVSMVISMEIFMVDLIPVARLLVACTPAVRIPVVLAMDQVDPGKFVYAR